MAQREVRIYKYVFSDGNFIEVEAYCRDDARIMLNAIVNGDRAHYSGKRLDAEYVIKPLKGVTKKNDNGISYTWVGFTKSPANGWQETFLYDLDIQRSKNAVKTFYLKDKK